MSDKLYTREDMQLAYDEGRDAGLGDYRNDVEGLPFDEFMYKHFQDLTAMYQVTWRLPHKSELFTQMIPAESELDAAQKAARMLSDKKMTPTEYRVRKAAADGYG